MKSGPIQPHSKLMAAIETKINPPTATRQSRPNPWSSHAVSAPILNLKSPSFRSTNLKKLKCSPLDAIWGILRNTTVVKVLRPNLSCIVIHTAHSLTRQPIPTLLSRTFTDTRTVKRPPFLCPNNKSTVCSSEHSLCTRPPIQTPLLQLLRRFPQFQTLQINALTHGNRTTTPWSRPGTKAG